MTNSLRKSFKYLIPLIFNLTQALVTFDAWADGDSPLLAYEVQHQGHYLSILIINPQARYISPAYIDNFISGVLVGATDWYLGLHEKRGAFTNPQEIKNAFLSGSESLLDERSRFSIVVHGKLEELFEAVIRDGTLKPDYFKSMVRLSVASYEHPLPPLHGRLGVLPPGFINLGNTLHRNDWGELKNLAQDEKTKIDFLPLALKGFTLAGWARVGGHLLDKGTGDLIPIGHPRSLSVQVRELNEIGDAFEIYNQTNLNERTFVPDSHRLENSRINRYYLEVLVPDTESEGLIDKRKAKGLLSFYYYQGFKVLTHFKDPTQPETHVAILGIDAKGWERIIQRTHQRPGRQLLDLEMIEIDFNNPQNLKIKLPKVQCLNFT